MFTATPHHKLAVRLINHKPFRNALAVVVACSLVIGVLVVPIEQGALSPRIRNVSDGLWWAVSTVTGVGYGDVVPVTTAGRVMGAVLEIFGVIAFGLIIGIIGITMSKRQEEYYWFKLFERIDQLEQKIEEVKKKSEYLVQNGQKEKK